MKLQAIYQKDIERTVNPAVSASDTSAETVKVEIDEYVFTDEIINGLYKILSAIQARDLSHNGIWINGYFGSGKSHFLKYLGYCLNPNFRDAALARLEEAVKAADPLTKEDSKSEVAISDMRNLSLWLKTATVDTILFNIGTVHNVRGNEHQVFLDVFWSEFNAFRGYNKFNLALAQHFEKVLDEKGKFEEFKEAMEEEGFSWEDDAAELAINELDFILEKGKELVPTLSIDIIREHIAKDETHVSVETFCNELKSYLAKKDDNYRLIFLVDEVSQFIDDRKGLLLQLQEIVTRLHETCDDKVWVTTTAQQDLQEILQNCQINATSEDYGKIMGRFEVKVSLTGTQPEYITQKRILDKNGAAGIELGKLYDQKRNAITAQFQLPTSYKAFEDKEDFINFYPFVPYQFRLIMQVFNSFVNLGFVEKEVKGNERSIIKVTHSTARQSKDEEVGEFISFDQFFGPMFKGALVAKGQRAIQNANKMIADYPGDKVFGQRIVNILFMICNLSQADRLLFPANVDNITCLLMHDVDTQKLSLKENVKHVLDFLCENNIIRPEATRPGVPEVYCFYSEDETEVAQLIKSQSIDSSTMAEELKEIFMVYAMPNSRENFGSSRFTVGASIMGKNFLSNNADINVDFILDSDSDSADQYAFANRENVMAFFMADLYKDQKQLKNDFYWFCQVQKYVKYNQATTELRSRTHAEFKQRAAETFKRKIEKPFKEMFDTCTVVSGQSTFTSAELGTVKGPDRYKRALEKHLSKVYKYAGLVKGLPVNSDELRKAIVRPVNANEYAINPLTEAEQVVDNYLSKGYAEANVREVVQKFIAAPYGWNEVCTLYVINELVRRHIRDYAYNNNQHVEKQTVANNIMREQQRFTVRAAQKISQEIINDFIDSWKDIFNVVGLLSPHMDSTEIQTICKKKLDDQQTNLADIYASIRNYPFATVIEDWNKIANEWRAIRDEESFFKKVIASRQVAKDQMDRCKQLMVFYDDQLAIYKRFVAFVRDNNFNFDELSGCEASVEAMRAIITDEWPIDKMPQYNKLCIELHSKLKQLMEQLRAEITEKYTAEVETLQKMAEANKVDYHVAADVVILQKCKPDNILVLKSNLDTSAFYKEESAKIANLITKKQPVVTVIDNKTKDDTNKSGDSKKEEKEVAEEKKAYITQVTLDTRNIEPIKNKQDLDTYLEKLRQQLQAHLDRGEEVIVL